MTVVERIAKMQRIINEFLGSPFAKQMVNSAPVRPPITRTNVILKNPDFKKALVLWQFIESYTKTGFAVENDVKKVDIEEDINTGVVDMICMSSMLMEGLIQGQVEDSAFFKESNLEETDVEEKEPPKPQDQPQDQPEEKPQEEPQEATPPVIEEKEVEVEKETEQLIDESGAIDEQTPQDEESQSADEQEEKDKQEEEEDELDEEADQYQELLTETKNVFQRTSEEATMSRAELQRVNKAIDRVLLRYRLLNSQEASQIAFEAVANNELERSKLIRKIEKEMEVVRHAIEKRIIIAERERIANENAIEKERKRLAELEIQLAEQKGLVEDDEDIEDEVIEDDVVGDIEDQIELDDEKERELEKRVDDLEDLLDEADKNKMVALGKAILSRHGQEILPTDEEQLSEAMEESGEKSKLTADQFKPKKKAKPAPKAEKPKAEPKIDDFQVIEEVKLQGDDAPQVEFSPTVTKVDAPVEEKKSVTPKTLNAKAVKGKKPRNKMSDLK